MSEIHKINKSAFKKEFKSDMQSEVKRKKNTGSSL